MPGIKHRYIDGQWRRARGGMPWPVRIGIGLLVLVACYLLFAVAVTRGTLQARNQVTVDVNRPVDQVFGLAARSGSLRRWIGGLGETAPNRDRPLHTGARATQTIDVAGRQIEVEVVITGVEPNRLIKAHVFSEAFESEDELRFDDIAGRTAVTLTAETTFDGLGYKLLSPVIQLVAQRRLGQDMQRLRMVAELGAEANP